MKVRFITMICLLSLAIVSCGPSQVIEQEQTPIVSQPSPSQPTSSDVPENSMQFVSTPESKEMPSIPPSVEKFVSLSKKDLADRLLIDADKIELVKTAEIMWPNAALGCPSPGKVYAQGQVPGYKILLRVNGTEYVYHTDLNGSVIQCPGNLFPGDDLSTPATGPTPNIGVPIP
jgi:hypothetical protein